MRGFWNDPDGVSITDFLALLFSAAHLGVLGLAVARMITGELVDAYLGAGSLLRHYDARASCPAFFVDDRWAERLGFTGGAARAWQQFRREATLAARAAEVSAAIAGAAAVR